MFRYDQSSFPMELVAYIKQVIQLSVVASETLRVERRVVRCLQGQQDVAFELPFKIKVIGRGNDLYAISRT